MSARRIILLLTAWLSFDLATPLPGAFEFEIKDSEIEHSIQVDRQAQTKRTTASRSTVRERVEPHRSAKLTTPAPAIASAPVTSGSGRSGSRTDHPPAARPRSKTTSSVIPFVS